MKRYLLRLFICLFFLFSLGLLSAGQINQDSSGVAIDGYDPVAYHTQGEAVKGEERFRAEWAGAYWHFARADHRDLFLQDPQRYAPRYGGHCANGLSEGHKVRGNPRIWSFHEDQLYFFFSRAGRNRWERNTEEKKQLADDLWQTVKND